MDNETFLTELRGRILQDIIPLAIDASGGGADRFNLMLRIIQTGDAPQDLYSRAYETTKSIEDPEDRLDALMALLDEVEYRDADEASDAAEEPDATDSAQDVAAETQPPAEYGTDHQQ